MDGAHRQFARDVLDESRRHIMLGGFAPSMWARWMSVSHTSGNALEVLQEMSCSQRINYSSESDTSSSDEESGAETYAAELVQPKQRRVSNVMHPEYGRKFRPVPSP
eukprot:1138115-Pleurochrysis_carterae.AAC.1